MPNAEYRPIPSIWGYAAAVRPYASADAQFIDTALKALLAAPSP